MLCNSVAGAAKTSGPATVVRGELRQNYARITFEWPQTVFFSADAKGKKLTLTFDRKLGGSLQPMLAQLAPYVSAAQVKKDGRTVVLTLDRPYKIRTFVSDNIGGVDLLGVNPAAHALAKAGDPTTSPGRRQEQAQTDEARKLADLKPAAGESSPEPAPAASFTAAVAPAAADVAPAAPAEAAVSANAVSRPISDAEAIAKGITQQPSLPGVVKVGVSALEDSAVLRFPFEERVAMAVFMRARSLWVVVNKPLKLDLTDFDQMQPTVIGKAELRAANGATVLRMPIDDGVYISVAREENTEHWAVLLGPKKKPLTEVLPININTDPPAPPHLFVPALEMAKPVAILDPQIGDEIVAVPLFKPSQGVSLRRDFVEFTLLQTAQGVALAKKSDDVAVMELRSGLRIALPQGATLTPGLPEIDPAQVSASLTLSTLFPYELWKPEVPDDPFALRRQIRELQHVVVEAPNQQEANEARLRLAQLYLSLNALPEALALIDGISRTNPSFYRSNKLNALRGVANFLMYRFAEAARDFSASELNNNKEIDFWRAVLGDLLGSPDQKYDYLALNEDYISKYPPLFRQKLAIVAADRSIAAKDYNTALKIFDTLTADKLMEPIQPYVNFLLAKIAVETGQEEAGVASWDKLAQDYDHPFVQARAEYSRVIWAMEHDLLPKEKVIDRLERLRLGWHGDSLELSILSLLGDMYSQKKDYVNAMRIWNGAVISFPNSAAAIDMGRKMQETFITMFNEGVADGLPPLDALALYYEYRSYMPGGATGNAIIERLADRLVGVDLLDQAALLLDHHMRTQIEKDQRSRVGTRLATIYLLNHQPKKALEALENSVYGENPLLLRLARNRVTAEAVAQLGQSDKALATLGEDNSADAERIRIDIYWQEKDWPKLAKAIEARLKSRPENTAPVSLEESEYLIKLALAYVFQNDKLQLQYLHDYFGPLMENNPNRPMFDFVTGNDIALTTTNFEQVVEQLSQTRNFIQNYSARIKTAGLQ